MKNILFILSFLFAQHTFAQSIVACYPFTGNANDASGNGNNATVSGATLAADRFGAANSAYFFNGMSDIITFSPINFFMNEYTVSVWCKPIAVASGSYGSLYCVGGDVNDQVMLLGNDASLNNIGFACGTWGNQSVFAHCYVGSLPTINDWHHIVFTRNNIEMKMFVDGQFICSGLTGASASYAGTVINGSIGARHQSGVQSFTGLIDDITVYNTALTDSQAVNLTATCSNVGLETISHTALNVFYNASNHSLNFSNEPNSLSSSFNFSLYNSMGQEVVKSSLILNESGANFSYPLGADLHGLYLLAVSDKKEIVFVRKVLVD